jgi:very-short-patch-repair endonuclease
MTYRPTISSHASRIQKLADDRRRHGTAAEKELEGILNKINGGVLRGRFQREWTYGGKWIIDFYFSEIRLAIEVEGGYHQSLKQQIRDISREIAIEKAGITVFRIRNEEIFGDRNELIKKLRDAWRIALFAVRNTKPKKLPKRPKRISIQSRGTRNQPPQSLPYAGGWNSIQQGNSRLGDTFDKLFLDEGISGSRDANRANAKQQFAEMRKRSSGN